MNTNNAFYEELVREDRAHLWHPYSAMGGDQSVYPVVSARGVRLTLADGRQLIDGMSSWWCAIHGYNHPVLNAAIESQLGEMAHVMFGGLTHPAAVGLASRLVALTPEPLQSVFFCDSGSVSVEVAMKMALQYWQARGRPDRQQFLTVRGGYHGDTFGAMSVCDPVTGMHTLYSGLLSRQLFAASPGCRFGDPCSDRDIEPLARLLQENSPRIAALIMEPVVQGAGGMHFYSADYLKRVRTLCDEHGVLLILDEIATGFGRSGKLFACEHAAIAPDIMCVGKALTGGYLSLAATLTTAAVSDTISRGEPGVLMHGPTFMANPLACAVALASVGLLLDSPWQARVAAIEQGLREGLEPCRTLSGVADVRVLGAIGVVELSAAVDMKAVTGQFIDAGVWVRPFGKLVYLMPPYIIDRQDLDTLTAAVTAIITGTQRGFSRGSRGKQ